jgi:CHAD domain-containing protein
VTARRMQTIVSLFRAYLPASVRRSRGTLKGLLDTLGTVRDADIRLAMVSAFRSRLPQGDRGAVDPLLQYLQAERARARSTMLRALDAKRTRAWLDTLPDRLARITPVASAASARNVAAMAVVPSLIQKRYRKLHKHARRLTAESSMSEFHDVRVRAKKLRYALEAVAPSYAKPAQAMLSALHKLQNKLGAQHDADVIADYLTDLASHPPANFGGATLFLMGRMAELHAREAASMGEKVARPWRRMRGKRWKSLRSRMQERRAGARASLGKDSVVSDSTRGNGKLGGAAATGSGHEAMGH